jgi:hypothetical protein
MINITDLIYQYSAVFCFQRCERLLALFGEIVRLDNIDFIQHNYKTTINNNNTNYKQSQSKQLLLLLLLLYTDQRFALKERSNRVEQCQLCLCDKRKTRRLVMNLTNNIISKRKEQLQQ